MVVLRLGPQVLEDSLLPVSLHVIPVINHAVADGVVHAVPGRLGVRERLVTDEEIEVFDSAFGREVSRL